MYKSNIKAGGTKFDEEMSFYVDGNIAGQLKSGQVATQYFCYGNSHQISVDYEVAFPADNSTRFKAINRFITVNSDSPDAEFIFYRECLISIVTNPPEVSELSTYSSDWIPNANWYKEGDLIKKKALLEVEDGKGTKYSFSHWLLPDSDEIDTNKLSWPITGSGKIIAYYKTYFLLDTNIPFIDIEGTGWKEKNTLAKWRVKNVAARLNPDIGAFFGIYLVPDPANGLEFMDRPKILSFNWQSEWRPAIGAIVIALIIALMPYLITHFVKKNRRSS